MLDFVRKLMGQGKKGGMSYEQARALAQSPDVADRLRLARDPDTHPEILYYLAERDNDSEVRRTVIENPSMPMHVAQVLVKDKDVDIRLALAQRIVNVLPDLSRDQQSQLYAYAVQALGSLALDEVLKIRVALSSTLRDHAHAPPKVVAQLARDIEREVAEPILRFCAMVPDEDLIEILRSHPASWAVQAVAQRSKLAALVSKAVVETYDRPSGVLLLGNTGAEIGDDTIQIIMDKAREYKEWQAPVATHKALPPEMARQLAVFADNSVRDVLMARTDFDAETANEIAAVFKRRLEYAADQEQHGNEAPGVRAKRLAKEKRLNEQTISDALAMRDHDFVYAALAFLVNSSASNIRRIFDTKAAKAIVSVTWLAGLSMRFALDLQKNLAHVAVDELIYPKGGTDYPLKREEIEWQLKFLELKQ